MAGGRRMPSPEFGLGLATGATGGMAYYKEGLLNIPVLEFLLVAMVLVWCTRNVLYEARSRGGEVCNPPPHFDFSIGRRLSTRLFRSLEV